MTHFRRIDRYEIEDGVRDLLAKEVAERVSTSLLDSDVDDTILGGIGAHALRRYLPGEVLHGLDVFSHSGSHALVLANLPVQEDLPDTPVTGFGDEHELAALNALHLGLIRLMRAIPFAVSFENDGRLIRNVVPNPAASGTTSSWGADSEFFWHSDNPHQPFGLPGSDPRPFMPQYLTFMALRNEERVPTDLAAIEDVVLRLDAETLERLLAPEFDVGAPASNEGEKTQPLTNTPVLSHGADGRYRVRFDRGTTTGRTPAAAAALERWCEVLRTVPAEELVLEPGVFLVFDNYRVLHRRRRFEPKPAAAARWLRRCYAA
ncbi:TauD/TfdA family dioxygenase [Microbispora sp. NPDC088329]|uniref:TauD/TfdA family dioxygenase n=1 Tax=Microbispora sp. NPDC088329 TaxID=3154869 RepID=UPI00344604C4